MLTTRSLVIRSLTAFAISALLSISCFADDKAVSKDSGTEIFNGKDLNGWVVDGTKTLKDSEEPVWSVKDGMIHCAGVGFGFLRYDEKVKDFELTVEYRLTPKCNSGIGIRGTVFTGPAGTRPSRHGYEIQLHDSGKTIPSAKETGSLYLHVPPKSLPANPAGEWNKIVIECIGPKIKITLNDTVIQDYDQTTKKETAKKPLEGYVSLQNHGGKVAFRTVKLKKIEPAAK